MKITFLTPLTSIFLQMLSFIHLYITYKNEHAHIPATLIELSVLSVINIVFLFLVAIFYLRKRLELTVIW